MQAKQATPMKVFLLLVLILVLAGCQTAPATEATEAPAAPQEAEPAQEDQGEFVHIDITGFSFDPGAITIAAGTTVTWRHDSNAPHTVTADDGLFRSSRLDNGDEFSFTFEEPGSYPYYCEFHGAPEGSGMSGEITVTD